MIAATMDIAIIFAVAILGTYLSAYLLSRLGVFPREWTASNSGDRQLVVLGEPHGRGVSVNAYGISEALTAATQIVIIVNVAVAGQSSMGVNSHPKSQPSLTLTRRVSERGVIA